MARPITINIPHSLGKDEARNRIASGFGRLQDQMTGGLAGMVAMQNRWEGNRLHFAGTALTQRITGRIDIEDRFVQMQLDVPDILTALANLIERKLQKVGQQLLEQK